MKKVYGYARLSRDEDKKNYGSIETQINIINDYATKNYVEQIVAGIETGLLKRAVVASLPSTGVDENTIYMIERTNSETNNVYDEYLYEYKLPIHIPAMKM